MKQADLERILARNTEIRADGLPAASTPSQGRSKYGNQRTKVGDRTFDSKKEAQRFLWLESEAAAGRIRDLVCQPRYELLQPFVDGQGTKQRGIYYVADFCYIDQDDRWVVEDVKSVATARNAVFRLKWKWLLYLWRDRPVIFVIV